MDYREMTLGSFAGLFVGYVTGKLSKVLVFIASSMFLLIEFLESRNIISLPYGQLYDSMKQRFGRRDFVFENASFKISFFLASIVAAWN
ncbi:uncharacterized protein V1516DRAFT_608838, partial [Lipomyces oligophaga]|uniref:uncharacterized protein n=1 Tax=Lipomyces oligophaga TaxID=45792 RepID=UPI0034CE0F72